MKIMNSFEWKSTHGTVAFLSHACASVPRQASFFSWFFNKKKSLSLDKREETDVQSIDYPLAATSYLYQVSIGCEI